MPRAVIWPGERVTFGGSGWMGRALVNRLTAGDFLLQLAGGCWLRPCPAEDARV